MLLVSSLLIFSEFSRWWRGHETHTFAVEKGVGHGLQINLDMVVKMNCDDLHINVQDAAGDRILAGDKLDRKATNWHQWVDKKGVHSLGKDAQGRLITGEGFHDEGFGQDHVHDIINAAGGRQGKFAKTPRFRGAGDSCRIFGSLDVNKVQGDFHITARGHGYQEFREHLDHNGKVPKTCPSGKLANGYAPHSIQFLSHCIRAFLRSILPITAQSTRPHRIRYTEPLPQIPILPLRRPNCLLHRIEQSLPIPHHLHQSVCRYRTITYCRRAHGPRYFLQIRY